MSKIVIEDYVHVASMCVLEGDILLKDRSAIAAGSHVKNSVLQNCSFCTIGCVMINSVLGVNSILGANSVLGAKNDIV